MRIPRRKSASASRLIQPHHRDRALRERISSVMQSDRRSVLAARLEELYRTYGPETAGSDPIVFVGRYGSDSDREVAGWIASAFAYGRVATIQANVAQVLAV